jgi:hypothetical protein
MFTVALYCLIIILLGLIDSSRELTQDYGNLRLILLLINAKTLDMRGELQKLCGIDPMLSCRPPPRDNQSRYLPSLVRVLPPSRGALTHRATSEEGSSVSPPPPPPANPTHNGHIPFNYTSIFFGSAEKNLDYFGLKTSSPRRPTGQARA